MRWGRASMCAALLWGVASAAPAAEPVPRIFDPAALGALLGQIRDFNHALQLGLDESTGELIRRLPGLWRELGVIEEQMQRSLPALRDRLQALERELREWEVPPRRPGPPPAALISV